MKPTGAPSLMNTKEVAAFLGVHVNTVARLVYLYKLAPNPAGPAVRSISEVRC